jgi:predicted transcriptional regulator
LVVLNTLQSLVRSEIEEISHKIEALDAIRAKLEQNLLKLQEDELELEDERMYYSIRVVEGEAQISRQW